MARGDAGVVGRWVFVTVWRWGLLRSSPRLSLCRTDPRADAHCLPGLSHWWDKWAIQERRAEQNNLWPNVSKSCSSHHHGNELKRQQQRRRRTGEQVSAVSWDDRFILSQVQLLFSCVLWLFFYLTKQAPGKRLYFSQIPTFSRISLNECNFESLHTGVNGY